ncbi:hypothetical protein ACEWPM_007875 [Roseovarius sp. S4756]|uniref:hypothetical protein n=1 Tax=Roseovarius maritimus TaxID=3342637 RepID=UPI00372BC7B4
MSRKFVSMIIAASIAVTGLTAAPAQAGDRDLARALAAIAGVAIVGAVIHDAQKDKRRGAARYYQPQRKHVYQPRYQQPRYQQPRYQKPRYQRPRQRAVERAYHKGYNDHRNAMRDRRSERRAYDHRQQQRYSARPYRRAH